MSAADEVASHIHGSLLDLRRRLDAEVAIDVARAVLEGATRALAELTQDLEDPETVPLGTLRFGALRH